jgi:hypothetical protein
MAPMIGRRSRQDCAGDWTIDHLKNAAASGGVKSLRGALRMHRVCLALIVVVTFPIAGVAKSVEKPNVVFIAVDDLNDWIVRLKGHPRARTPNIDQPAHLVLLFPASCRNFVDRRAKRRFRK